jgi:hypothetical protein
LFRLGWGGLSLSSVGQVTEVLVRSNSVKVSFGGSVSEVSSGDLETLPDDTRAVKVPPVCVWEGWVGDCVLLWWSGELGKRSGMCVYVVVHVACGWYHREPILRIP